MAASEAPHEYQRAASEMNACVHTMAAVQDRRAAAGRVETADDRQAVPCAPTAQHGAEQLQRHTPTSIAVLQLAAAPDRTPRKTVSSTLLTNVLTLQGSKGSRLGQHAHM